MQNSEINLSQTMIQASKMNSSWENLLKEELQKKYMKELYIFLQTEISKGKTIYPKPLEIFNAMKMTSYEDTKVVIVGQDPYHGLDQAHGLSFSVPKGVRIPPSLKNIYKELKQDMSFEIPTHGDLTRWAKQGVLLLNSVLTVEAGQAASHRKKGWEKFTDQIITLLNQREQPIVFMLWGSYAQKKAAHVDREKHLVLESVHPSPLSAYRGFLGCRHFSQANQFLSEVKQRPIDWSLSE